MITLPADGAEASASTAELGAVLRHAVDKDGYVDLSCLQRVEEEHRRQLRRFAVSGPTASPGLYPGREDRLAYWLNARSAWSIELARVLHGSNLDEPDRLAEYAFPLDGRTMTLADIDAELDKLGGYLSVVAAPSVDMRRAALPREVFYAAAVRESLEERFCRFINNRDRFVIDVAARAIRFPKVLWQYREQIVEEYQRTYGAEQPTFTTALLPKVRGPALQRLQNAVGYRCVENRAAGKLAVVE